MDQIVMALSGLLSIVGMGSSAIYQGAAIKQQLSPPAQQQVVQQCPPDTQMMTAMQNGQPVIVCIPQVSSR